MLCRSLRHVLRSSVLALVLATSLSTEAQTNSPGPRDSGTAEKSVAKTQTTYERTCRDLIRSRNQKNDSQRFQSLVTAHWEWLMQTNPEWSTYLGRKDNNDRWTDMSSTAISLREREMACPVEALKSIRRNRLSPSDQLNYDLLLQSLTSSLEGYRFDGRFLQISQLNGPHQRLAEVLEVMPKATLDDYQNILQRLKRAPEYLNQTQQLLKQGLAKGITPPRAVLGSIPEQFDILLTGNVGDSALMLPFREFSASIPQEDQKRIRQEATAIVTNEIFPALRAMRDFLQNTYIPGARSTISWSSLPQGPEWYAYQVRESTTTALTPDQIHQIGLNEVQRIRSEMEKVMAQVGFKGGFEKFFRFLRTDKRFFFDKPEDLLTAYRDIAKRADPELIRLFQTLPRLPYGVAPIPSYAEKSAPTAYYQPGSIEARRPGLFQANTYDLKSRPKWEMEALTLHEAVPGHHLQIALAQEMEGVPEFRKRGHYTAFVEGWALYAESLGEELGFYKDPYAKFGQLTYEMWRACRLVVDTGLHSKGWTRQQAIDFMKANMPKPEHDIKVEVDRYIVWAGQALAYKLGELKIKELRKRAELELAGRFDIRTFHDTLLENGALPLDVLDARMTEWIAKEKKKKTAP